MKFTWKIFLSTLFIVLVSLSVGGTLMISLSFRSALDNEISRMRNDNRMMGLEIAALIKNNKESLYQDQGSAISEVLEVLGESWSSEGKEYQIQAEQEHILGGNVKEPIRFNQSLSENHYTYMITKIQQRHLIQAATVIKISGERIIIISRNDISQLFQNRREQIDTFCQVMFAIGGFSALVNALLAVWLTRSVFLLTKASKSLSEGDMKARVKTLSKDEIGMLSGYFNQMADSLEEKIIQLEDAARRQEDFVGSFTHELKTPLTSIIGYADLLRSRKLDETTRFEAANYIFHEGKRLEKLSIHLLEFLVEGKNQLDFQLISLSQLIEEVIESIRPELEKKKIVLINTIALGEIKASKELIKIVILNLLDNARKAVEEGGTIKISSGITPGGILLSVKDNGRGIPKQDLNRITEAFYMVDKSRSREEGGAGLGLAICARIMQLHEAQIRFESKIEEGTSVYLLFKKNDNENE